MLDERNPLRPVRIHALGAFSLTVGGNPVGCFAGKAEESLEFLRVLIALGGRDVSASRLVSALWPHADGVTARNSLDAALSGLRGTLREESALVSAKGSIGLDPRCCWVDVWDYERTLALARRLTREDDTGESAARFGLLSRRLQELYRGHLLSGHEASAWSVSPRERLRSSFLHHLLDAGRYWEKRGLWDKAIGCYRRGLELDELVEAFYQGLLVCCRAAHRIGEGAAAYRQCRRVLSTVLGLRPAPETEALYRALAGTGSGAHAVLKDRISPAEKSRFPAG